MILGCYRLSRFFTQLYRRLTAVAWSARDTAARGNNAHPKEKTMKLNRYLAGLLVASSVAFALPAQAHRAGHGMDARPGSMRMLRGLDLTQEQRAQAQKIFQEQAPALRERASAAREAHDALRKATLDPNADAGRMRELAAAAGRAHAEAALLRAEAMRRVLALLSPEQRHKLEQARERRGRG
jgi:Spy/CpxP family protein refolding chaperone